MVESSKSNTIYIIAIIIAIIWLSSNHNKIKELESEISYLEDLVYEYEYALDEANFQLEDAQSFAWSSYEEMGYTLENLYPVDEPY